MKKIHSLTAHQIKGAPGALRRDNSRKLIHGVLNQLCVINLCSFKLRARRSQSDVTPNDDPLRLIEQAVTEASELAEALKTIWEKPVSETRLRGGAANKNLRAGRARLKIVTGSAGGAAQLRDRAIDAI